MTDLFLAFIEKEYEKRLEELEKSGNLSDKTTQELSLWYQEQLQMHHDEVEGNTLPEIILT
jgi:hypothetical protein